MSWQSSFLAMSAALGEEPSASTRALAPAHERDPAARELAQKLESKSKAQRAQALAMALGAIAKEVARMDLAEGSS